MKHDLNRLKSGGGQEGAAPGGRGQGRQSTQSESDQLEKAVASVRQCHSKMFALKNGTGSINQDGLTETDRKELVGAIGKLEDLFGAYGTMKNTQSIPGEPKPTTSTMIFRKIKEGNLRLLLAIGTGDAILAGLVSKAAIGVVEMQGPLPRADRFKLVAPVEEIGFMRAFCL